MCRKRDSTLGYKSGKEGFLESIFLVQHQWNFCIFSMLVQISSLTLMCPIIDTFCQTIDISRFWNEVMLISSSLMDSAKKKSMVAELFWGKGSAVYYDVHQKGYGKVRSDGFLHVHQMVAVTIKIQQLWPDCATDLLENGAAKISAI